MIEKIDYSPTFSGFVSFLGFFVIAIGMISIGAVINLSIVWIFFTIPISTIGVLMMLNLKGVLLDYSNKKIKFYKSFLFFNIGEWRSIDKFTKIQIFYDHEIRGGNVRRGRFHTTKLVSYEICLIDEVEGKLALKELSNPAEAKKIMKNISEKLKIPYPNEEIIRVRKHINR